jgi:hypothetical protein
VPLSPRERILYKDKCDVYRPSRPIDNRAKPGDVNFAPVATGVACFFAINTSLDTPQLFGRAEEDRIFTYDSVHFDKTQDVQPDDILVLRSLDADGTRVANYGKGWVVRGMAQSTWDLGRRRGGLLAVYASQIVKLPPGVGG